jgi:hypothetical protein
VVDGLHEPAEEPVHQPAGLQFGFQLHFVVGTGAHLAEYLEDAGQDDQVEQGDQVQEAGRQQGPDGSARGFVGRVGVDNGAEDGPGRHANADADRDDEGGVTEGEEEPGGQGPLAVGHQLAGGVVDARDVVGVEGVPEPQQPGRDRHPDTDAQTPGAAFAPVHPFSIGGPTRFSLPAGKIAAVTSPLPGEPIR